MSSCVQFQPSPQQHILSVFRVQSVTPLAAGLFQVKHLINEISTYMARKIIPDLSGQRFGRYLVLRKDENRCDSRGRHDFYICKCDCGAIRSVKKYDLLCGTSKSCGCATKEEIIAAINLPEHTRILVDALVKQAKERSEK